MAAVASESNPREQSRRGIVLTIALLLVSTLAERLRDGRAIAGNAEITAAIGQQQREPSPARLEKIRQKLE